MPVSKVIFKASASATPEVWMDSTTATALAEDITAPKTAMLANGVMTEGTGTGGSGGGVNVYQDQDGYIVLDPNGGGGGDSNPTAPEKQINFIDYDGVIRYSYTAAEFAELEELPANPTHTGRVGQGWNWTLAQINAQLSACPGGVVWVGQNYTTSDGKTHIRIVIPEGTPSSRRTFYVRYTQTDSYGVSIDWGDGTTPESHSSSGSNVGHFCATPGEYDISVYATIGTVSFVGSSSSGSAIYGSQDYRYNRSYIREIAFGDDVTSVGEYAMYGVTSGVLVTVPSGVSFGGYYMYGNAVGLPHLTIPTGTTSIAERMFRYCAAMQNTSIPSGVTSIGANAFAYCTALTSISIPAGVTSIGDGAFTECYSLTSVHVPPSVTSIGNSAFSSCTSVGEYHFYATTPPTLGSSAFSSIPSDCVIYVPSASVNAYKSATNWSAYSSYIQGE